MLLSIAGTHIHADFAWGQMHVLTDQPLYDTYGWQTDTHFIADYHHTHMKQNLQDAAFQVNKNGVMIAQREIKEY